MPIPVDSHHFRVDIDDGGIAYLVFGPDGGVPLTDAREGAAAVREMRAPQFVRAS